MPLSLLGSSSSDPTKAKSKGLMRRFGSMFTKKSGIINSEIQIEEPVKDSCLSLGFESAPDA